MSSPAVLVSAPRVPPGGVKKPVAKVAKGSPPPRVEEPPNAPSAFTRRGGRSRRHRRGRKTRHRRHRGGGQLSVVQKGDRWYIRETSAPGDFEDSEKNWATKEEAEAMVASLQKIKNITPDQEERKAIAVAASGLANMKKRGGRRHH